MATSIRPSTPRDSPPSPSFCFGEDSPTSGSGKFWERTCFEFCLEFPEALMLVRHTLTSLLLGGLAAAALALSLRMSPSIDLRLGPGDRDYAQGFSDPFRFDGKETYRRLDGRGRLALPLLVREGGTLEILARPAGSAPA